MVKKTINESWTYWVIRQKKRGVSKENIRQILVRENYSQEIFENLFVIKKQRLRLMKLLKII